MTNTDVDEFVNAQKKLRASVAQLFNMEEEDVTLPTLLDCRDQRWGIQRRRLKTQHAETGAWWEGCRVETEETQEATTPDGLHFFLAQSPEGSVLYVVTDAMRCEVP